MSELPLRTRLERLFTQEFVTRIREPNYSLPLPIATVSELQKQFQASQDIVVANIKKFCQRYPYTEGGFYLQNGILAFHWHPSTEIRRTVTLHSKC